MYGLSMSDTQLRIHFMGEFYEIDHLIQNYYNSQWHYLSVTYRRENYQDTTTIYIQIDDVEYGPLRPFGNIYDEAGGVFVVEAGRGLYGYIKQVRVQQDWRPDVLHATLNDHVIRELPEAPPPVTTRNCAMFGSITRCEFCSTIPLNTADDRTCYVNCTDDSWGKDCSNTCNWKCLRCNGPTEQDCIQCKPNANLVLNDDPTYQQRMCICERGYWQDDTIPDTTYTKCVLCNPVCDTCVDNTNKCEKCTDGMFRYLDTYCEEFCPEPYFED